MTNAISALLIANRGEIACRIIRTARSLGVRTIAVYSGADASAPHVALADEAVLIGPAPAAQSYLDADKILAAAKTAGADAIHPGYGFLSENAGFAEACAAAGIIFVGPSAQAIDLMGDKAKAKRRMVDAGVPCVPGYQGEDQTDATLIAEADKIGFPVMVKAAAGGGGRGMRLVAEKSELPDALSAARSEALNAFGADGLIIEKAVMRPRHVEIQVFADQHGGVIHLGERDCSVQRRHQKVIEEAPCPVMTPELREKMGAAAVEAARAINYEGAGTVEFLLDEAGAFYFLEMNTRLQVEHPVTEMITGLDLVAMQLSVAQGGVLPLSQDDLSLSGWAIEARLYAEDTSQGFLPAAGPVKDWHPAEGLDGIRIDAGVASGGEVSTFYDPMVAKIIAHGDSRDAARRRLIAALKQTSLFGFASNKKFLIDTLEAPAFAQGEATTAFIDETFTEESLKAPSLTFTIAAVAAAILFEEAKAKALQKSVSVAPALTNWASAAPIKTPFSIADQKSGADELALTLSPGSAAELVAQSGDETLRVEISSLHDGHASLTVNGARLNALYHLDDAPGAIYLSVDGADYALQDLNQRSASADASGQAGAVTAPMHGMLTEIFVKPGDTVAEGDRLAILEAMKMQHELRAAGDGAVKAINASPGEQVEAGAVLIELDIDDRT